MKLTLTNLHPSLRPRASKWRKVILGLHRCLVRARKRYPGFHLSELSVVWMDDRRMAGANWRFLRHRGPTDILTFPYGRGIGEILISLDTTHRQAVANAQTFDEELTLYLAHGMLHLAGVRDKSIAECRQMRREETWLIQQLKTRN